MQLGTPYSVKLRPFVVERETAVHAEEIATLADRQDILMSIEKIGLEDLDVQVMEEMNFVAFTYDPGYLVPVVVHQILVVTYGLNPGRRPEIAQRFVEPVVAHHRAVGLIIAIEILPVAENDLVVQPVDKDRLFGFACGVERRKIADVDNFSQIVAQRDSEQSPQDVCTPDITLIIDLDTADGLPEIG